MKYVVLCFSLLVFASCAGGNRAPNAESGEIPVIDSSIPIPPSSLLCVGTSKSLQGEQILMKPMNWVEADHLWSGTAKAFQGTFKGSKVEYFTANGEFTCGSCRSGRAEKKFSKLKVSKGKKSDEVFGDEAFANLMLVTKVSGKAVRFQCGYTSTGEF